MSKRVIALVLALVLIVTTFAACTTASNTIETTTTATEDTSENSITIPDDDSTFKLSYTQADSLDPFKATTQNNLLLTQLVFEGLFTLDDTYKASLNIASSYEYLDSKTLKVTIRSDLTFSDKTKITAEDVAYSFRAAKKSSYWKGVLEGIKSVSEESDNEVIFYLSHANKYAQNLLYFPIASTEDKNGFPIGSGRYYFANVNNEVVLKARNTNSFNPHLTVIHLENIVSSDSIDNAINIGNISFAYRDLSKNLDSKISANKKLVNTNDLIFLGVNNKSGLTANTNIRKAISLALDRETLAKSGYNGFATAATGVFNPQFELSTTNLFETTSDVNAAKQALAQSGTSDRNITILTNKNEQKRKCAILIKQELEEVGFNVKINVADSNEKYQNAIKNESFCLYIGEIKLPADMSLYAFLGKTGAAHYGINSSSSKTAKSYMNYIKGNEELGTFLLNFSSEMPYIPLVYKSGMICFTKTMNGDMQGNWYDCFKNIENWYFVSQSTKDANETTTASTTSN